MNGVLKRSVGRSPQMGPTSFLLHLWPVQRKLDRQEAAGRGGRAWPDKELCLPSRVVSPFRVSEPHFLENDPEVSTGTLPRGSPAGKQGW